MALVTIGGSTAINFDKLTLANLLGGTITVADAGRIGIDYASGAHDDLIGSFTYDANGALSGGTLNGITEVNGQAPVFSISGLATPIPTFLTWVTTGDNQAAKVAIFSGPDSVSGGSGDDTIRTYAGDDSVAAGGGTDRIDGGAGNDAIDGGDGNDTALYSGAARNYGWVNTGGTNWTVTDYRVGAPDGTDTLKNVESLQFTDQTVNLSTTDTDQILRTAFDHILRYAPVSAADLAFVSGLTSQVTAGTLTKAAAIGQIVQKADASTAVANIAYEFFTGLTPTGEGLDYLVSPSGGNTNNLNSAYYLNFNLENRYINFAVNLGKLGEGASRFTAQYGSLSLFDATKQAYATIFGATPTDAKVHALIDTRADYFAAYGLDGPNGIGTKAAMVGWLLAEAVKADVGTYATSNNAFFTDLADGAAYHVDMVGVYPGVPLAAG